MGPQAQGFPIATEQLAPLLLANPAASREQRPGSRRGSTRLHAAVVCCLQGQTDPSQTLVCSSMDLQNQELPRADLPASEQGPAGYPWVQLPWGESRSSISPCNAPGCKCTIPAAWAEALLAQGSSPLLHTRLCPGLSCQRAVTAPVDRYETEKEPFLAVSPVFPGRKEGGDPCSAPQRASIPSRALRTWEDNRQVHWICQRPRAEH